MGSAEELDCSSRRLAQRFLRTAVVVDDKAYMEFDSDNVPETVVAPDRRNRNVSQEDQDLTTQRSDQSLDARSITNSFSTLGVICGVVGPAYSEMDTMRQADIVVLDWRLKDDDSEYALVLLYNLLTEEKDYRNSLRLVAIYTGENQLEDISSKIVGMLNSAELSPNEDESSTTISYRHGRVVHCKVNV